MSMYDVIDIDKRFNVVPAIYRQDGWQTKDFDSELKQFKILSTGMLVKAKKEGLGEHTYSDGFLFASNFDGNVIACNRINNKFVNIVFIVRVGIVVQYMTEKYPEDDHWNEPMWKEIINLDQLSKCQQRRSLVSEYE